MAYFNSSSLSLCTTMNGEGGKKKNLSGWRMGIYHRLCVSPPVYGRPGRWHDVRLISEKKLFLIFPAKKKNNSVTCCIWNGARAPFEFFFLLTGASLLRNRPRFF